MPGEKREFSLKLSIEYPNDVAISGLNGMIANPSPKGRGCRGAAGEGDKNENTLKKYVRYPSPGPLARATLSRRERDLAHIIFQYCNPNSTNR